MMSDKDSGRPLDMAVLVALFGSDERLRFSILDDFSQSMDEYLVEFEQATDLPQLRAVAHKLKSSARTVGANPLADICAALEAACRNGQQPVAEALLARVAPEMARVNSFLAQQRH